MNKTSNKSQTAVKLKNLKLRLRKQKRKPSGTSKKSGNNQLMVVKEKEIPINISYESRIGKANISSVKEGGVRIRHTEYIMDLTTVKVTENNHNGFNVIKVIINFGLQGSFPWGSSLSQNFENYRFTNLAFMFKPMSNTLQPGSVMQVCDFDPSDPPPPNKVSLLERKGSVSGVPYRLQIYKPSTSDYNKQKSYYLRTFDQTISSDDLKFYDCANYYIAYVGTTPDTLLGELWISYDVHLITPSLDNGVRQLQNIFGFQSSTSIFPSFDLPLGQEFGFPVTLKGSLISAGFIYTVKTLAQYLNVSQKVQKIFTLVWSFVIGTFVPPQIEILTRIAVNQSDSRGITFYNEDEEDAADLADFDYMNYGSTTNDFIDTTVSDYHLIFEVLSPTFYTRTFAVQMDPTKTLVFYGNSGTTTPISGCLLTVSDYLFNNLF